MSKCHNCKREAVKGKLKIDFNEYNYCSEKCKSEIENYLNFFEKNSAKVLLFLGLLILSPLITMLVPEVNKEMFNVIYFIALGIFLIKFPFATYLTNIWIGLKKSFMLVQVIGLLCILFGLYKIIF